MPRFVHPPRPAIPARVYVPVLKGEEESGVDVLEHVSPIEWDNVLLYGEYIIDRSLVQVA